MGYGLQVGQTAVKEHRSLKMPIMVVCELGRQPQFVLMQYFQSTDTYSHQLTAPFGPGKQLDPLLAPACVFLRQPWASRNEGVNCG